MRHGTERNIDRRPSRASASCPACPSAPLPSFTRASGTRRSLVKKCSPRVVGIFVVVYLFPCVCTVAPSRRCRLREGCDQGFAGTWQYHPYSNSHASKHVQRCSARGTGRLLAGGSPRTCCESGNSKSAGWVGKAACEVSFEHALAL